MEPAPRTDDFIRTDFGGGSWQSVALDRALRATIKTFLRIWARTRFLPWPARLVDYAGLVMPPISGVTYHDIELPQCRAQLVTPERVLTDRFVVYLHGGAFLIGGKYLHRQLVGRFAERLSAPVLHVNYRKLPRHSISDAIVDSVDGYRYALGTGVDPKRIVVMGDSAGGYLTFTTALEVRDARLPLPGALVAMAPLTDWALADKTAQAKTNSCAVFPTTTAPALVDIATRCNRGADLISPAHYELSGLPPTLIQASSAELVFPDALLMARQLAKHGVAAELQVWDKQVHVFQAAAGLVPEATAAIHQIVEFIDRTVPAMTSKVA